MKLSKQEEMKAALNNALESIGNTCPELKGLTIVNADARLGKRFALANENGYYKTDFLTYPELNQFLRGYMFKAENRFTK